jgi:hypothetical protein
MWLNILPKFRIHGNRSRMLAKMPNPITSTARCSSIRVVDLFEKAEKHRTCSSGRTERRNMFFSGKTYHSECSLTVHAF